MRPRQEDKRKEKKEEIFQAALPLFARNGFSKTTIEDVARQTSMTKGNLYFYVKNKQDLYHQTIHWALTRWQARVSRTVDRACSPTEKFLAMARSAVAYIASDHLFQQLLATDPDIFTLDRKKDRFPRANQAALAIIRQILKEGTDQGEFSIADPEATARYLFSTYMMFLIQNYVYMDNKDFHSIFEAALELNLRGLLSHPPPSKGDPAP